MHQLEYDGILPPDTVWDAMKNNCQAMVLYKGAPALGGKVIKTVVAPPAPRRFGRTRALQISASAQMFADLMDTGAINTGVHVFGGPSYEHSINESRFSREATADAWMMYLKECRRWDAEMDDECVTMYFSTPADDLNKSRKS